MFIWPMDWMDTWQGNVSHHFEFIPNFHRREIPLLTVSHCEFQICPLALMYLRIQESLQVQIFQPCHHSRRKTLQSSSTEANRRFHLWNYSLLLLHHSGACECVHARINHCPHLPLYLYNTLFKFIFMPSQQFTSTGYHEHTKISGEETATTDDEGKRLQRWVGERAFQ